MAWNFEKFKTGSEIVPRSAILIVYREILFRLEKMIKWMILRIGAQIKVKVDAEDWEKINRHSWRVIEGSTGRKRIITSIRGPKGPRNVTLGRFLVKPPKGKQVYPRRFNDELDYRKENLMVCTLKERQRFLPKNRKAKSSKYRGVSFTKTSEKWRAAIEVDGKSINLGNYDSEDEAALVYNRAARKHFGEICYQNPVGRKTVRRKD